MPRKGEPATPEAQRRWRHYATAGRLHMALVCVQGVERCPTAIPEARAAAKRAEEAIREVIYFMQTQKEPTE